MFPSHLQWRCSKLRKGHMRVPMRSTAVYDCENTTVAIPSPRLSHADCRYCNVVTHALWSLRRDSKRSRLETTNMAPPAHVTRASPEGLPLSYKVAISPPINRTVVLWLLSSTLIKLILCPFRVMPAPQGSQVRQELHIGMKAASYVIVNKIPIAVECWK